MKKKILELTLERMTFGGEAIASHQGKKVFIAWGVPGDRAKVEFIEEKRDYARGRIVELLEKSPHRTEAPCPYFFKCGGCQWQHVKYESQLAFKTEILKEALQRTAKISEPFLKPAVAADSPLHYRSRIRLQVSRQGEVGFFKPQSKEVVPVERCLIAEELLNAKISEAKEIAQKMLEKDRANRYEIEIRREGDRVVMEVDPVDEAPFVQVNEAQNEKLIRIVQDSLQLSGSEKILELFAGEGNFTFPVAAACASVTAVESGEGSVLRAEKRIEKEHRKNIRFVQSTAYRYLENSEGPFDRVLLDPPRKGAIECLEGLAKLKIPRLVYVSCDPSTLARDVRMLQELGYCHESSQVIDMFPQTYHVESVTVMVRA
ncbi:MAG: class I SAM-dependent RNA methyltransferase [bacterium]